MRNVLPIALAAALLLAPAAALAGGGFKLIVNADQKAVRLSRDEVSRIFLKKLTRWDGGAEIRVVQPKTDSPVRQAFDPAVHKMAPAAVRAYWAQMVFSGRDVPPLERTNDEAIVAFVRDNPGAIGLVSEGASLGGGVRVVELR